jgi:hypothetical protein
MESPIPSSSPSRGPRVESMFNDLTSSTLAAILSNVEPVELKGVALLRQCHPTSSFFPAVDTTPELVEATVEIIGYTRACEASLRRLKDLRPIPVTEITIEEFSI